MRRLSVAAVAVSVAALILALPVAAQEVMLRSDLPLWAPESDGVEPFSFHNQDGFGCATNIGTGEYVLHLTDEDKDQPAWRIHLMITGFVHCAFTFSEGYDESNLGAARTSAWAIPLDTVSTNAGEVEILALQIGARPGSEYRLFTRSPEGALDRPLTLLDPRCPRGMKRRLSQLSTWRTDYCAVPNRAALRRIARDAARRPPVGVFMPENADTSE